MQVWSSALLSHLCSADYIKSDCPGMEPHSDRLYHCSCLSWGESYGAIYGVVYHRYVYDHKHNFIFIRRLDIVTPDQFKLNEQGFHSSGAEAKKFRDGCLRRQGPFTNMD